MKYFIVACFAIVLTGCASYPDKVAVTEGTELVSFSSVSQSSNAFIGKTARFSGVIANVSNEKAQTKLDVLYYPASNTGRPKTKNEPLGRFRVVVEGFVDPAVYLKGKAITALGTIKQPETAKIGEYEYEYPTLISNNIHLWKEVEPRSEVHFNYAWHGIQPRWHWRGGVRQVYIVGEGKSKKPVMQAKPKSSRN